jgi:transcriptional regulator with PAS, ATPase and Fis domain
MARKLTYNELEQTVKELEKDLLAYKNAKEFAVKDKEELACIFNAIPDYIATIDNRFKIHRVNRSLANKLKCSPEELMGKPCYRYFCLADRPGASCPHAQMLNDGKVHISGNYSKQFGMNMLVTSSPLYDDDGRLTGGVLTARDTKIYKRTEETGKEYD